MAALDSRLALALMAKAQLVFGSAGKILSFPLAGAAYSDKQLNFFPADGSAEAARDSLMALSGFSSFANIIPGGRVWETGAGAQTSLANLYRRVIEQSVIADVPESEDDRERLAEARARLFQRNWDGTETDTQRYT